MEKLPLSSLDTYFTVSWLWCVSEDRMCNIVILRIESIKFSLWLIQIILLVKERGTLCRCSRQREYAWTRMFSFQLAPHAHGVFDALITFKAEVQHQRFRYIVRIG